MASFCESCGSQLAGARFCPGCGRAVGQVAASAAAPLSQSQPPVQPAPWAQGGVAIAARKGSALPKILIAIVVLVAGVIGISLFATSGPADAVTAHLAALSRGDDAAAYAMTSSVFRSGYSAAQFTAVVNANPILRRGKVSITERQVVGDESVITVELTAPDETKQSFDFQLAKEGGSWKIVQYGLRAPTSRTAPAVASAPPLASAAPAGGAPAVGATGGVPCSSTAAQAPDAAPVTAAAPKLRLRLQASPFGSQTPGSLQNTSTRTFSIAALQAQQGESVFLMADAQPADFPNSNFALEMCDPKNLTYRPQGNVRSITGFPIQTLAGPTGSYVTDLSRWTVGAPGAYRVDAYVWLEKTNTWYLVARMPVTLTP